MILAFALSCSLAAQEVALDTVEADRAALLRGVDALAAPGTPGWAVPFGAGAFALLTAEDEALPVISAARAGRGRVLALAHGGWLAGDPLEGELGGTRSLLENALSWCAGGELPSSIVVWGGSPSLERSLQAFTSGSVTSEERIEAGSVVVWGEAYMPSGKSEAQLVEHVRAGGGLICAVCPWGWAQVNARRGLDLRQGLPWNRVLAPLGLAFTEGTASGRDGRFSVGDSSPRGAHANRAQRSDLAVAVVRALPPALLANWGELAARLEYGEAQRGARPTAPLASDALDARLWVVSETYAWHERAPDAVGMAPGAEEFPGAVPADVPRVTRSLRFSADVPGWQSTGLYLAPGEVLVVRTAHAHLWRLRIGAHTDSLWHKARWQRWPSVSHSRDLEAGEQRVATPYGGALFLEARAGQYGQSATPELVIEFEGAVEAPYFDATDPASVAAWSTSRAAPAPWAELDPGTAPQAHKARHRHTGPCGRWTSPGCSVG